MWQAESAHSGVNAAQAWAFGERAIMLAATGTLTRCPRCCVCVCELARAGQTPRVGALQGRRASIMEQGRRQTGGKDAGRARVKKIARRFPSSDRRPI